MTGDTANQFVSNAKAQWASLVKTARSIAPRERESASRALSAAAGVGKSTLRRKLEALHMAMNAGLSDNELIERGQRWVMAKFVTDKRNGRQDEQVVLKWLVAPELREAAIVNSVRVGRLLHFTTSNEYWAWLNAQIELATDEEIRHAAGMINAQDRRKP